MTPMIDIVFQLNIFFLFTFKIILPEGDFNIHMPSAAAARAVEPSETLPLTLKHARPVPTANWPTCGWPADPSATAATPSPRFHQYIRGMVNDAGGPGTASDQEIELDCRLRPALRLRHAGHHGDHRLHRERRAATNSSNASNSRRRRSSRSREPGAESNRVWSISHLPSSVLPALPAHSRPRMKRVMHLLEPRVIDVRVDLRRRDAGVTEHFLHLPQVGPAGQQVRRKAVPQRVRA